MWGGGEATHPRESYKKNGVPVGGVGAEDETRIFSIVYSVSICVLGLRWLVWCGIGVHMKMRKLVVSVTDEMYRRLVELASEDERSVSAYVRKCVLAPLCVVPDGVRVVVEVPKEDYELYTSDLGDSTTAAKMLAFRVKQSADKVRAARAAANGGT